MIEKLFDPTGRIGRTDYAFIVILLWVSSFITGIIPIFGIFYLIIIIVCFIQGAKRCHDLGHNGFYQLIPFYFFVMLFKKGQNGKNRFGDDTDLSENSDIEEYEERFFCNNCNLEVELDESEKSLCKFICPGCNKENKIMI